MRVLLDAHVSSSGVGARLEKAGHDVRALDREPELEGLDDDSVLALAAEDGPLLITHNVSDFPRILRGWAESGRAHAGVILVYGIDHSEFDLVARGVEGWFERRPRQEDWVDFPAVLDRGSASN